jgi:MoaA/NifB/PqqE/SkfB family radical SAM enzyme
MLIPNDLQPKFLFLSINEMCNLRCLHCDYWRTKQPSLEYLSLLRQREILAEFARLSPSGKVVICGGEPMLDPNTYFEVCRVAHLHGLQAISVVNGTMIATSSDAERLIREGPNEISISLDGPNSIIHDRVRGRRGSFDQATTAVKLLLDARKHLKSNSKIYAMGLLSASTYHHLEEFYHLVLVELGADKLKLNCLQPTFANIRLNQHEARQSGGKGDTFFEKESQVDPGSLENYLHLCSEKFSLNYNPKWIAQVVSYFRGLNSHENLTLGWLSGAKTEEQICNTHERNIMVNVTGDASLCFSNAFPSIKLREPGDLTRFWEGRNGEGYAGMPTCRALCGISHSVRRESATLNR